MARIGRKGRLWLRAFHIFFMVLWIGACISQLVILSFTGMAQSDGGLRAMYKIPDILDVLTGPGMLGTMITGVLLAWLTPWGFFKHKWVIYTMVIVVIDLLSVFILGNPLLARLSALVEAEGLGALQNPEYASAWNQLVMVYIIGMLLFCSAIFVSVIKPWRKREAVETASS